MSFPEGAAIVYCQSAFRTTNGKTAHGLVRRSERYRVLSVVDADCAGEDAGALLDGRAANIPVLADVPSAVEDARARGIDATHLVVGLAPDGGLLPAASRDDIKAAIRARLHVVSGLHSFLSEDPEMAELAAECGVRIHDVRKCPPRDELHFFSGQINEVTSLKVALLGTDSAIGKRTTAWILVDALRKAGRASEFVGTGQTAWMQGARYGIILDSLINDFVAGEIEHAVWRAWSEQQPEVIVVEGQGSLMNPAYPGGFEILAAARPDIVVLQHAPARKEYDGFPGNAMHSLEIQVRAIELISGRRVVAVTINHEGLDDAEVRRSCEEIRDTTGLPAFDVLKDGPDGLVAEVISKGESIHRLRTSTEGPHHDWGLA